MNNLISVLVPVYNGMKYLPSLVEAFKRQTYKNFEVIFIDDFSNDGSYQFLQNISASDGRFKTYKRDTKGGNAVKGIEYGLPYCKGDWYWYITQDDDKMEDDFLDKVLSKAIKTNADIVIPNFIFDGYNKSIVLPPKILPPSGYDYESFISARQAFFLSLNWTIHGRLFRRMSIVRKAGMDSKYYNSCEYYERKTFLFADKIVFCNVNTYYRVDNPNAITKKINYFTFEVLATNVRLLHLLIEYNFGSEEIDYYLKHLVCDIGNWRKTFMENKTSFNQEQQKYIKNIIKRAQTEVVLISLKRLNFHNAWRVIRSIRGIYRRKLI